MPNSNVIPAWVGVWKYIQDYADAKTTVVQAILARAQEANGGETREDGEL